MKRRSRKGFIRPLHLAPLFLAQKKFRPNTPLFQNYVLLMFPHCPCAKLVRKLIPLKMKVFSCCFFGRTWELCIAKLRPSPKTWADKKSEPKKIGEIWIEMGMGLRPLGNEAYYAYSGGCRHRNGESVYSGFVMV